MFGDLFESVMFTGLVFTLIRRFAIINAENKSGVGMKKQNYNL